MSHTLPATLPAISATLPKTVPVVAAARAALMRISSRRRSPASGSIRYISTAPRPAPPMSFKPLARADEGAQFRPRWVCAYSRRMASSRFDCCCCWRRARAAARWAGSRPGLLVAAALRRVTSGSAGRLAASPLAGAVAFVVRRVVVLFFVGIWTSFGLVLIPPLALRLAEHALRLNRRDPAVLDVVPAVASHDFRGLGGARSRFHRHDRAAGFEFGLKVFGFVFGDAEPRHCTEDSTHGRSGNRAAERHREDAARQDGPETGQ